MNNSKVLKKTPRKITTFFVLTYMLPSPIWILCTFVSEDIRVGISLLVVFIPMISAVILTFRENGSDGIKSLIKDLLIIKGLHKKFGLYPS